MNFSTLESAAPVIGPVVSPLLIISKNGYKSSNGSNSAMAIKYLIKNNIYY